MKSWIVWLVFAVVALVGAGCVETSVTLTSSTNPSVLGQPVTLTATVTPTAYNGTVFFYEGHPFQGGTLIGESSTQTAPGTYTMTKSDLTVGEHELYAAVGGGGAVAAGETQVPCTFPEGETGGDIYCPSVSEPLRQVVLAAGLTISLGSSRNPAPVGDAVTFTATLSTSGPAPGGTVTFRDTFNGQTTTLGQVAVVSGQATFTAGSLAAGNHAVSATFDGDATYAGGASASIAQRMEGVNATITVTSNQNPSTVGQALVYTAQVTVPNNLPLTGSIRFDDAGQHLGVVPVNGGIATISTTPTQAGSHYILATYTNDPNVNESYGILAQTVSKANSTLTLSQSSSDAPAGTPVTFTATVATPGVRPTGSVRFFKGDAEIGLVVLDANGVAKLQISTLPAGASTITARYPGDMNVNPSEGSVRHTVTASAAQVTVTSAPSPSKLGNDVRIEATVSVGGTAPAGVVTFSTPAGVLGTSNLDAGGKATFITKALPLGATTLTASFEGGGFYPSGNGSVVHVVDRGDSAISLTSTPNPSRAGEVVTFVANLTSATAGAGGDIEIFDNGVSLGTFRADRDTGSYTTDRLPVGVHNIVVKYKGSAQLNGSDSTTLVQTVLAAEGASSGGPNGGGSTDPNNLNPNAITVGSGDDDGGCSVSSHSTGSSQLGFAAIALALFAVTRRRRVA